MYSYRLFKGNYTDNLNSSIKPKQWAAYTRLDPRVVESGKSISKKRRLSKAENRHLPRALYLPALRSTQHDLRVSSYYQHVINDNGLAKLQALYAVMRKLLHAIHGIWHVEIRKTI